MAEDTLVLLVGHGTVSELDQLPEFLKRIRRGRPAPDELIAEMRHRYSAIGGSPLLRITEEQAAGLSERLGLPCRVVMRFWSPTLDEILDQLTAYRRVVLLPMAPFSVHIYSGVIRDALAAFAEQGRQVPEVVAVTPYGEDPAFVAATSALVARSLAELSCHADTPLILTAHSLPLVVLRGGDPYAELFGASATAIGKSLGRPTTLAYQSQGASGGEWLGPALEDVLKQAAQNNATGQVAIAPVGFVADHVETLFDLDIEARGWAKDLGLELLRVPAHNTDPAFLDALADVVRRANS
ncbi:MAG: ferrochelatase [Polyangiaceae bacterium]|nr:ferrochelatase [Myxococcales bacterium]MCB9586834.1 ferrochelatase [Polyangiaceae bacterium]MCB9606341.1 ferrochelatase [Polyangiaceae bacterium]